MEEYSNLVNAPESCGHLKLLGATKSKNISIDFDGEGANIAPLEVHCQLSEGLTKVGEPIEIKADNCSDPHCFLHEIRYSAADLIQIQHLMDKSAGCSQEIQVKCLSAPMQFQGEDLFTWIDKAGSKHSFRELNSSQICDEKAPVLLEEMAKVTNKDFLPILGFTYGSVDYEGQELTVKIDSLICLPDMEMEEENSIPNKLLRLENGINSTNEDLVNQGEELQSVKLNLQNQINSKASEVDLQTVKVDVSSKASIAELHSVKTNLENQINSKASEMDLQTLTTDLSKKASVIELHSAETNLKNQINSKASKMDLQTMTADISSRASVTELNSVETNLKNQIDSKASETDLQTLKVRGSFSSFFTKF